MSHIIYDIFTKAVYIAGIGAFLLAIPTVVYLVRVPVEKDGMDHHFMSFFLAIVAVSLFAGIFFTIGI
jgi:Sec-independent protein secretion pathway component TatC